MSIRLRSLSWMSWLDCWMVRGHAWVMPEHDDAIRLDAGDIVINRGPRPYTVADDPATPPRVIVHPGQRCATPDGVELAHRSG